MTWARSGCGPNDLKIASLCVHIWVSGLRALIVILLSFRLIEWAHNSLWHSCLKTNQSFVVFCLYSECITRMMASRDWISMEAGATVPFAFLPWSAVPFPTLPWGSTPQTWPPILTELVGINNYLNSKILTLRPCRRTLWQSQASCLLPCRLDNILIGSVACCVLLFDFCFANIVCWGVYWLNGF